MPSPHPISVTSTAKITPRRDHDAALALQLSREWGDDPTTLPPPPTRPVGIPTPYGRPVAGGVGGREGGRGGGGGAPASGGVENVQGKHELAWHDVLVFLLRECL